VQRTYEDLATHYGTTVLPARARKPSDEAKVEVAVPVVQRCVLACVRNEVFASLEALNRRLALHGTWPPRRSVELKRSPTDVANTLRPAGRACARRTVSMSPPRQLCMRGGFREP
jgi:transposase